jgi:hypothetical protein
VDAVKGAVSTIGIRTGDPPRVVVR